MKNKSIWEETDVKCECKKFKKNLKTDVLIVGSGITGISIAYFLKESNAKITVVDMNKIGGVTTRKTTGKVNYLQGGIYEKLERTLSIEKSKLYFESQREAVNLIKKIIKTNNIDCDFKKEISYDYAVNEKNNYKIKREYELLNMFTNNSKKIWYSDKYNYVSVSDGYSFHPIKFINGLINSMKDNVDFYENICVLGLKRKDNKIIVKTNKGYIYTKKIIFASHYPFFIYPLLFPLKTYVKREYVCASPSENKYYNAINVDDEIHSIRYYGDYIIYTSNEHKITNKLDYDTNYEKPVFEFKKLFNKDPEYLWMNQDIVSHDNLPLIGLIRKDVYIASAFNAWGMTNSILSGKILSDLILNKENKYYKLFDPKRVNLKIITDSFINTFSYLKAYTLSLFKPNPYYIKKENIIYGVYHDKEGIHKIKLLCPHMKCKLIFNKKELTWDCPCHGSRFDINGNLINGPSNDTLKK